MVPLQAADEVSTMAHGGWMEREREHTKLLLDDLENLLLVKFLWKTLDSGQSLTSITLCESFVSDAPRGEECGRVATMA